MRITSFFEGYKFRKVLQEKKMDFYFQLFFTRYISHYQIISANISFTVRCLKGKITTLLFKEN
jgi:hypothetical protein